MGPNQTNAWGVLQDARSGRAGPLGHGFKRRLVVTSRGEIGSVGCRDWIRALKACPERSEGRRLGEDASPEGLIASFRTRVVAEPAL